MAEIQLVPLETSDREQFIRDNQEAFNYGALEEFGQRDDHFEEDGEIISHETISRSINEGTAFRIMQDNKPVGGVVIRTEYDYGELELLFVSPSVHSKGIGYAAWCEIEIMHPEVTVWETVTPYFEKRNIHFYVNRCGFHIVEYFNEHHCAPDDKDGELFDMFRFEKMQCTQPTLSHHMKILCDSGLVVGRKEGKWMYYSISAEGTEVAVNVLRELTKVSESEECCCK